MKSEKKYSGMYIYCAGRLHLGWKQYRVYIPSCCFHSSPPPYTCTTVHIQLSCHVLMAKELRLGWCRQSGVHKLYWNLCYTTTLTVLWEVYTCLIVQFKSMCAKVPGHVYRRRPGNDRLVIDCLICLHTPKTNNLGASIVGVQYSCGLSTLSDKMYTNHLKLQSVINMTIHTHGTLWEAVESYSRNIPDGHLF